MVKHSVSSDADTIYDNLFVIEILLHKGEFDKSRGV